MEDLKGPNPDLMDLPHQWVHRGTASKILGVHPDTLIRWDKRGLYPIERDDNGRRIYRVKELWTMYYRCFGKRNK